MIFYILLTLMAVIIASGVVTNGEKTYMPEIGDARSVKNRIGMAGLFTLLFLPAFFRINTGNDYPTYIERFHDIYRGNYVVTEKGFNLIAKFIYCFFNSECYLWVFGFFAFFTILFFLMAIYKQSTDFKMSIFLYMTLGIYFQCYNTVRYYFALAIVVYSMQYIVKKDYFRFIVAILIASLFHKSALVCIPVYLLARIKHKRIAVIIVTLFSLTGVFLSDKYIALFMKLYPSYHDVNEIFIPGFIERYKGAAVNIFICAAVLAVSLYFYKELIEDDEKLRFYFYLNYAAFLIYSCFCFVKDISRIGYYMNICQILFLPSLISKIKDDKKRRILKLAVYGGAFLYFIVFLIKKAPGEYVKILPYHTWLFEEVEFLPLEY